MKYYSLDFAQMYGSNQYGNGSYSCTTQQEQDGTCTAAASGSTDAGSSGSLTNTGIAVMGIVTIASLIIFVSLVVRIWRRKPLPALQPQEVEATTIDARVGSRQ